VNVVDEAGTSVLDRMATVAYATLETPIGLLQFFGGEAGLMTVALPNEGPPAPEARVRRLLGDNVEIVEDPAALTAVLAQFEAYFRGELRAFDLPLDPRGTPFQRQVWAAVARVPYGETRAYGEIAAAIGKPAAVRAVGLANGANPLPIVIPCHRVIGANGSLTGYGGGLEAKRRLLALERGQPALLTHP
jgi:methylated-DNA-[protein]-cysteine S-methyltransferase